MVLAYFTRERCFFVEAFPQTERFNSTFFTETILLNIVQSVSVFCPKLQAQGYWMHEEDSKPHNSALSLHKTEELGLTRLAQPPYFFDLTPYDFFLFGYLKKELQGKNFKSQNMVMSGVMALLTKIPIQMLS
jgi:hypothetical protein